jgi:hypothetical protein
MKHLKTFENFSINEEEALFGLVQTNKEANAKISAYVQDITSGKFEKIEDLKKSLKKYVDGKPAQGIGSAMGQWMGYVSNVNDFLKAPKKPEGQLEDAFGKMRPAAEVLEEEIARVVIKDRLVSKNNGKWDVESKGRSFGSTQHSFGGGAGA